MRSLPTCTRTSYFFFTYFDILLLALLLSRQRLFYNERFSRLLPCFSHHIIFLVFFYFSRAFLCHNGRHLKIFVCTVFKGILCHILQLSVVYRWLVFHFPLFLLYHTFENCLITFANLESKVCKKPNKFGKRRQSIEKYQKYYSYTFKQKSKEYKNQALRQNNIFNHLIIWLPHLSFSLSYFAFHIFCLLLFVLEDSFLLSKNTDKVNPCSRVNQRKKENVSI